MIQVYNNSVACNIVASASMDETKELCNYINKIGVDIVLFDSKVRFSVTGIKTIPIPQKALKSFKSLSDWIITRINNELNK